MHVGMRLFDAGSTSDLCKGVVPCACLGSLPLRVNLEGQLAAE